MARRNRDEYITIDMNEGQMVHITDVPSGPVGNMPVIHHAKLLKCYERIMTFAFCVKKNEGIQYAERDELAVAHQELSENYSFNARVLSIRRQGKGDKFSLFEMGSFLDGGMYSVDIYEVYIVELVAVAKLLKRQRRQYYRSKLDISIYYKLISESEVKSIDPRARFASRNGSLFGNDEDGTGYSKIKTLDVSAGGFRFLSTRLFDPDSYIDCLIVLENEAIPVPARVLACEDMQANLGYARYYQVRCQYEGISDVMRDKIMRYIFEMERRAQRRLLNK